MKKYILFILLIGIVLSSVLVYNTLKVEQKVYKTFANSGYILQSKQDNQNEVERYYFAEEQKYKENYNTQITFEDINGEKLVLNKNNFIHYTDDSISAFTNGVLVDLTGIESDPIFYYNIKANKTLTKAGDKYTIQNLNKQLSFTYPLWKIDSNKYLIAGNDITVKFEDGTEKQINGYLEFEYLDNEVIKLYNQEIIYQTIGEETIILLSDDIEINLSSKIVRKNDENQMSLENMVIDSEDNVTIVDLSEEAEEEGTEEGNEESGETQSSQNSSEQVNNNQQTNSESNEQQSNNETNLPQINGSGDGTIGEIVDNNPEIIQAPKFKITKFDVSATGVTAGISITDEEILLKEDTKIKIIRTATGRTVYETTYPLGEYEIEIDVQSLEPDTEYILQVESGYQVEDIVYQKNFIYKTFRTNITGVSFEKDVFTNTSMSFKVKFEENSQISRAEIQVIAEDGREIETKDAINENLIQGSEINIEFSDLDPNTQYEVKLTNVLYSGQMLVNGFDISKTYTTLKNRPIISGTEYEINKRDGNFVLKLTNVEDDHSGITGYRYEIYDTRMETQTPVKTVETNKTEITVPIDDTILRNVAYTFKVVAIFNDNEKICEYESEYSQQMRMDGAEFPTVSFEEEKVTFERIEGTLVIEDNDHTVQLDDNSILHITYTDSVGKTETFTSQGSLRIPVLINNLRANETYKFAVYGTVDLKDGNDPVDKCYIGGAIIKTKEPENMVASYQQNTENIKSTFSVNFQLSSENLESEELEAQTLTGMVFNIYAGQTTPGEAPQGALQRTIKVVDTNIEPYASELKTNYYDNSIELTPEFFGAKNEDFREEYYTITVSDAYDYTDYENELPIINSTFVVKTNGYMPDLPDDVNNAVNVKPIRNYMSETPSTELQDSTVVGYKVKATYDNSGGYARKIIYRAIKATTNEQVDIIELEVGEDGNIPEAIFNVENGTAQNVVDISGLVRGNEYYFTYEVGLDLNDDGTIETYYPLQEEGQEVVLKSTTVSPEKEKPQIILYPTESQDTSRTYKYQLKDVDNALTTKEITAAIGNRIVDKQILIESTSGEFRELTFNNLYRGNLIASVQYTIMKTSYATQENLIEEYFEQKNDISNIKYRVSLDSNRIVINLQDSDGNTFEIQNLEKIAALQVILTATDNSVTYTSELKTLSDSNTVTVNYNDIGNLVNKEVTVTVKAYYDSGRVGYEANSSYVVYQKAYLSSEESYYYILNNEGNLTENSSTTGHLYYRQTPGAPNVISIINAVNSKYQNNITLQYSSKGMMYQYGTILQKEVDEIELIPNGNNIIKFNKIIPGISMQDDKGNLEITSELDRITFKATLIKNKVTEIKDDKIYIDIYETTKTGANPQLVRTIELDSSAFENVITIDNLSPKTYYAMQLRAILNTYDTSTGTYIEEERYLYDIDYEVIGRMYYFSTLTDVGIDNIEVKYIANSYEDKDLQISYTLERVIGYDVIKYTIKKYNEETNQYETIDYAIKDDEIFNKQMKKLLEVNPGSVIDFGAKYQIEITPIANVTSVTGEQLSLELGQKTYEFELNDLKEPVVAIRGDRIVNGESNNIDYRITIYDEDRIIVGNSYKVIILDDKQNDITPEEIKNGTYSIEEINKKFTIENVDLDRKYTIRVILNLDYENKNANIKEVLKEYTVQKTNEYGITIGEITALTNSNNEGQIDLRFTGSYKLEEIDRIKYSVYNTGGYLSTQNLEFIPSVITAAEDKYYMYTLQENIINDGTYYIEIQFIKEDETEGEILIENRTVEYVYISK